MQVSIESVFMIHKNNGKSRGKQTDKTQRNEAERRGRHAGSGDTEGASITPTCRTLG
jgi:hypothetical protein